MKAKTVKGNWSLRTNKLSFPYVFLVCIFFFLAGFFGFTLFSHSQVFLLSFNYFAVSDFLVFCFLLENIDIISIAENSQGDGDGLRPRQRLLEPGNEAEYNLMPVRDLGDDSITSIPFQVCILFLQVLLNLQLKSCRERFQLQLKS